MKLITWVFCISHVKIQQYQLGQVEAGSCSIYTLCCSCVVCTLNMVALLRATIFLLSFFLSLVQLSTCSVVKGTVSCVDCTDHDLSGVRVGVKCGREKPTYACTDKDGYFETELLKSTSPNCFAMLLGGTKQLCSSKKALISKIFETEEANSFTIATPLTFSSKCPSAKGSVTGFKSSKTIDLPVPREWGLAPTSYYLPFFPIIGIP